jgi:hypothetical protein
MAKKIITIGFSLASSEIRTEYFQSKTSLLDWDIILFKPSIDSLTNFASDDYLGKPCLSDASSFHLKESCEHWRREIKQALDAGRTIIIFLSAVEEVYVATGNRTYSGTGRNARATRIVEPYTNYQSIPFSLKPITAVGNAMKLTPFGSSILKDLWGELGPLAEYQVTLSAEIKNPCLVTKNGDKPVGLIVRSQVSSGAVVLLPDVNLCPDDFMKKVEGKLKWTPKALSFAAQFTKAILAFDKLLNASADLTPEPNWAADPKYQLAIETKLGSELLEAEAAVESAQKHKEKILQRFQAAGRLRSLLYEKGKPLESAIIEALRLLGFEAAPYKQGNSEFDVVFECAEGRLLGEAEGKDAKSINVDKLRQLTMNIHEDLEREEISSPAKGVLFGNAYRLTPPADRQIQFTEKCVQAAKSLSIALLSTSELYLVAQYLSNHPDANFAGLCRTTILTGVGLVTLPSPPNTAPLEATKAVE